MEDLTLQPTDTTGLRLWQGTGFATVEVTTMPVDQTATDVVQSKMIILQHMPTTLQVMDLTLSPQDGRLETGFAQGLFTLSSYFQYSEECLYFILHCHHILSFQDGWYNYLNAPIIYDNYHKI